MSVEGRPLMHASHPERLLRDLAPQVLGALVRRYGHFADAEDATQEALAAAATQWPRDGMPASPKGWLITAASRRLIDQLRRDEARRRRENNDAAMTVSADATPEFESPAGPGDDTLELLYLCCHPALTPASQLALTLRAVGGLTTAEIALAFLVPETTMGQRISRAKAIIAATADGFRPLSSVERDQRLDVVLHVLYLIFNEGYTASGGAELQRAELTAEALRITRVVRSQLPDHGEVAGLLALMLLTDARRPARTDADGALVTLVDQDRRLWNAEMIAEGVELISATLATERLGPYQLQAAIAAVHDEATDGDSTDWPQILALYDMLASIATNPVVTMNRAVAVAMVHGSSAGLAVLDTLRGDMRVAAGHRLQSARAHLLELHGDLVEAEAAYRAAARATASLPEQRYLLGRAERLSAAAAGQT